jgi:TPR repeat protein
MNAKTHYQAGLNHYVLNVKQKNMILAIEHFTQAAHLGHADAHYFLGRIYGFGDGVTIDYHKAINHYHEGLSLGSAKCAYALGLVYYTGNGVEVDQNVAKDFFKQSYDMLLVEADHKDPVSIHLLGTYYYYGFTVARFMLKALEWFIKSAEMGYSDSEYMLGMIYESTAHEETQKEQAESYYLRAANQDHPYAQYALGINYLEKENYSKAIFFLEKAANQQYGLAAYTLGLYYHEHEPKYPLKAFEWFMVSAKQNHTQAEYYVGLYYQNGKGVEQNIDHAIHWYEKAAVKKDKNALYHLAMILIKLPDKDYPTIAKLLEQAANLNHPNAQYNLAVMYHKGDGVEADPKKAFFWYEKASDAGLAIAQYNLGMIFFEGAIVPKDEEKAKSLWEKAAKQGLEAAVKLMYSINNYEKLQKSSWQS